VCVCVCVYRPGGAHELSYEMALRRITQLS